MAIVVKQKDGEKPVEKEILAQAITRISDSIRKLYSSGLNKKAVVALLKDDTGMTKREIEQVLDSLTNLHHVYCK